MIRLFLFLIIAVGIPAISLIAFADHDTRTANVNLICGLMIGLISIGALSFGKGTCWGWDFGVFALRFGVDGCTRIFGILFGCIFLLAGVFSLEYMDHDHAPHLYNMFFLLTFWAMLGLSLSQNLFTYYMCYELMTVLSLPLVIHERTDGAMKAGMKYLGYSLFGASLALFGFFCLSRFCNSTDFVVGGSLKAAASTEPGVFLFAVFCLLIGFGCKAGIMPLHFWLPTAHPVAPAPASAVLSATITKAGVLGIIRVIYYIVGADAIRGTWVQYTMLTLALITVFSGSMLAFKEKLMKRRFAWSTVSQVSYVLFGVFLLTGSGLQAALLQVIFHAVCKTALFLTAGAIIHHTGCTYVSELKGVGREMPLLMACYTLASLSLIGIPPFAGFVSKWQLVTSGMEVFGGFGIAGGVVLLTSAILTAGYLLPISIDGFMKDGTIKAHRKPTWRMNLPMMVLSGALLLLGLFPHGLLAVMTFIGELL
ncbi:MAG: proton-conducting membrane transporter [Oscillospiraceae bacterium]|nr:proton-conducting membrane transporter [Oscillospiraceae bacterium]